VADSTSPARTDGWARDLYRPMVKPASRRSPDRGYPQRYLATLSSVTMAPRRPIIPTTFHTAGSVRTAVCRCGVRPDSAFAADPEAIFANVAWPTPSWGDDEFPATVLDFRTVHSSTWPQPHRKAGMGELKFLNGCMSFLMGQIRNTTRDFLAVTKNAGEEIKANLLEG
jgi:hypothetical protein